jgi:hypothetical protein
MVVTAAPQLKVITPPAVTAARSDASVQLSGVPVPMTFVGFDVSASVIGGVQSCGA